jgi:tetratricopeptide (TPR) repeat protein
MPSAIAAAKRAIELDPNCGEAYTALGAIDTTYLWDWNAAEQNLRKGIALSPSSSHAQIWLAYLTEITRPVEAVDVMKRAVALDPLSFWANRQLGATLYYARRYDESLAALKRASELAPDKPGFVGFWISADYEMQGRYADAVAADLTQLSGLSPADVESLRFAFESRGWKGYQEARVKILPSRRPSEPCRQWDNIAMGYLRLGNMSEAFQWFNREVDRRCSFVVVLPADPRLDDVRTDSRYTALLSRINLPPQP